MKFSTIILLTISSLFFISPIQSTVPIPGLVKHVCRLTPHYYLCVMTLKSTAIAQRLALNAASNVASNADIAGFARVTLEVIGTKAPVILETLNKASGQAESPQVKIAINTCITSYTKISKEIVPQALDCVEKGDYNGVKQNAFVTGNLANSCEKKCNSAGGSGGSSASLPLGDANVYVQNMCAITVSIVTKLAEAKHQTVKT